MDDLVKWLGEQLDEDERTSREAASHAASALATRDRKIDRYSPPYDGSHWSNDYDHVFATDHRVDSRRIAEIADCGDGAFMLTPHIAAHDPARVLREIDAKRQLIARGGPFCTSRCDEPGNEPKNPDTNWTTPLEHHLDCGAYQAAALLAAPYDQRPGYKETWRP